MASSPLEISVGVLCVVAFHVFFGGEDEDEVGMQAKDLETQQI